MKIGKTKRSNDLQAEGATTERHVPSKSWDEYMHTALQDNAEAAAYLEAAIDENDPTTLMLALRRLAEARGGIGEIAARTGLSRETLYRTLSERGNPRLSSLTAILQATGLRLAISPA